MPLIRARRWHSVWAALAGRHVYLDSNVFIAHREAGGATGCALQGLFALFEQGIVLASTSELALAEVLVLPLAARDFARSNDYRALLEPGGVVAIIPVSRKVLEDAAALAAETRMALPDSIHVATAMQAGCDVFVSNDRGVVLPSQMQLRRF